MIYKSRTEPQELQILNVLDRRMDLSLKDKQHFLNLKKGFEGELAFDRLTVNLQCDCLILNDLLLQVGGTTFQIDTLIITSGTIYLFDVKYHDGDYYYEPESDKIFKKPKYEILNPLIQLSRAESLLSQLLQNLGFHFPITSSVVFNNPEFTLYQAPLDKPFIFPTQINQYLKRIDALPSKITSRHKALADKLISLHLLDSPYKQIPTYDYSKVKKGIICLKCGSFEVSAGRVNCVCGKCGFEEEVTAALMRNTREFTMLFPDKRLTTRVVQDWCKIITCRKRIHRILDKNFKLVKLNRWSYYE